MKRQLLKMLWDVIEAGIRYGYPAFVIYQTFGLGLSTITETKMSVKIGVGCVLIAFLIFLFFKNFLKDRINEMPHSTTFTSILRTALAWIYESVPYVMLFAIGLYMQKLLPQAHVGDIEAVNLAYDRLVFIVKNISTVLITSFICFMISKTINMIVIRPIRDGIEQEEFERRLLKAGGNKK